MERFGKMFREKFGEMFREMFGEMFREMFGDWLTRSRSRHLFDDNHLQH